MENPQHVPSGLVNSHMDVPKGARLQDGCPKCGEKPSKYLYNNNNRSYQVRVQCLRTDCKHKYQLFVFRKLHPNGYKKVKVTEPEQYVDRVKVCPGCGRSDVKFYGLNNNDTIQARYKCLNSACKKLFTPFGNSHKKKRNHQEMMTADSHVADNVECIERTSMNDLQYSTSNDHSPMTDVVSKKKWNHMTTADSHVVDNVECFEKTLMNGLQYSTSRDHAPMTHVVNPLVFAPRAYYDTTQNYRGVGERLERLRSWINANHEFRNVPTASLQEDDQVTYGLPFQTTCDLKLSDPAMAFMPTPTILQFEDRMSRVVVPNPTPTAWQEDRVYVLATPTGLLQQED